MALATFADWRDSAKTLSGVGATAGIIQIPIAKGADELPESVPLESVTPSFFTVLGVTPLVGRAPDESNVYFPGRSDGGVAISERLWRTRFAADPSIVGQTIRVGSPPVVPVVGILPASFSLWYDRRPGSDQRRWSCAVHARRALRVIGREIETTPDQAREELNVIARNIEQSSPARIKAGA